MAASSRQVRLLALLAAALTVSARGSAAEPDALPAGAVARLGTARFANVGRVLALAFSPDGKTLAAGSWDGDIWLWDVAARKEIKRLTGIGEIVRFLSFSPDGRRLTSAWQGGTVRVWDVAGGKEISRQDQPKIRGGSAIFSQDGSRLAVLERGRDRGREGADPSTVRFWDQTSLQELGSLRLEPHVWPLALGNGGTRIAVYEHRIRQETSILHVLDVATGKELPPAVPVPRYVQAAAFSPDGRTLAHSTGDTLRQWDLVAGKEFLPFAKEGDGGGPPKYSSDFSRYLVFSPDGKALAAAGGRNSIHVWEAASARERCRFESPITGEICVAISPDGRTLASGGLDVTVLLWDLTGVHRAGQPQPDPKPEELPALWDALESTDAARAYRALWRLVSAGRQGVACVASQLKPVRAADPERVAHLLTDLDSREFATRDKASRELEALRESAVPFVRAKLAGRSPSLEARRRLERLLEKAEELTPHRLRELRAIEMLERAGTPQAREVLQSLAEGVPEARLTQEARAARDRLAKAPALAHPTAKDR